MNEITLKSIKELLKYNFIIPDYQRGYRWEKQQVEDLLRDIDEFNPTDNEDFYCLQPIIVREEGKNSSKKEKSYVLIDGQQRLTTIHIILSSFKDFIIENSILAFDYTYFIKKLRFLKDKIEILKEKIEKDQNKIEALKLLEELKKLLEELLDVNHDIEYKTREKSKDFLEDIKNKSKEEAEDNIDFYYMYEAYETIKRFFDKFDDGRKKNFLKKLLNHTNVIWYELDKEIDKIKEIETFTRINIGKVPLTNAELIKALFLRKSNFKENDLENDEEKIRLRQLEIANEWDFIENTLQNDEFWYFIKNKEKEKINTRIEFIFDIIAERYVEGKEKSNENLQKALINITERKNDKYYTFYIFNTIFKYNKNGYHLLNNLWKEVKTIFYKLQEWYNDKELFHKIGYLVYTERNRNEPIIVKLINKALDITKDEFKKNIDARINEKLEKIDLDNLQYNSDNENIEKVLLLFNICSIIKSENENYRFSFNKYKDKKWSLEHIHPQNPDKILKGKARIDWLDEHIKQIEKLIKTEENFKDQLKNKNNLINYLENQETITSDKLDDKTFTELQQEILEVLNSDSDNKLDDDLVHSLRNLTLLSTQQNSSLNNAAFIVKRQKIIEMEKEGEFIPICTKNVFLKYYNEDATNFYYWTKDDGEKYFESIKQALSNCLTNAESKNEH